MSQGGIFQEYGGELVLANLADGVVPRGMSVTRARKKGEEEEELRLFGHWREEEGDLAAGVEEESGH